VSVIIGLGLWLIFFCIFMVHRNNKVFKERMRVLDSISDFAKEDIRNGRDFNWRYKELETISYNQMMWQFWIPVGKFFKEMDCIKP